MKKTQIFSIATSIILFSMISIVLWILPKEVFSSSAKPAARLGDMTAHGGSIVTGCPTVLIGGKPAARVGDRHVCPMVDYIIPHVGGPIIMGSSTVIIGGMPAARVTDIATCVGPPAMISLGCPNVLIGHGGADNPKKYSLKYIQSNYNKSLVITEQEFKRIKKK
jgi:uncharacterized Zn-binding protein involved in type VI secretion